MEIWDRIWSNLYNTKYNSIYVTNYSNSLRTTEKIIELITAFGTTFSAGFWLLSDKQNEILLAVIIGSAQFLNFFKSHIPDLGEKEKDILWEMHLEYESLHLEYDRLYRDKNLSDEDANEEFTILKQREGLLNSKTRGLFMWKIFGFIKRKSQSEVDAFMKLEYNL